MSHRYGRSSRREGWGGFAPYVPVAERRAKAEQHLAKMKKKGEVLHPVVLAGSAIATKWWGKAWCRNLESYADFSNRIGRGRSYVRHGAVLDLRIEAGAVLALVQGSRPQPYRVGVDIAALDRRARERVETACRGQLASLAELLGGQFPEALQSLFADPQSGLFPAPEQITFRCSCPDGASMCKHVAAVLFGIGARFDEDPGLFFALRGIDPQQLVGGVVRQRTDELLAKATRTSKKVLDESDLGGVFGIELADPVPVPEASLPPSAPSARPPSPPAAPPARGRKATRQPPTPQPAVPPPPPPAAFAPTVSGTRQDRLLAVMRAHPKAENALFWMRQMAWSESQTRNALANLMDKGHVDCPVRGRYAAVKG